MTPGSLVKVGAGAATVTDANLTGAVTTSGGVATTLATGLSPDFASISLDGQKFQSFEIAIVNTAGTLQHQIIAEHRSVDVNAGNWADKITGASATLANTPTVGAGVDFTSGVGINANRIVFNTAAQTIAKIFGLVTVEGYSGNVGGFAPRARLLFNSRDVNGTTRIRLEVGLNHPYTDAQWTINTTNIPSGTNIGVRVLVALA